MLSSFKAAVGRSASNACYSLRGASLPHLPSSRLLWGLRAPAPLLFAGASPPLSTPSRVSVRKTAGGSAPASPPGNPCALRPAPASLEGSCGGCVPPHPAVGGESSPPTPPDRGVAPGPQKDAICAASLCGMPRGQPSGAVACTASSQQRRHAASRSGCDGFPCGGVLGEPATVPLIRGAGAKRPAKNEGFRGAQSPQQPRMRWDAMRSFRRAM